MWLKRIWAYLVRLSKNPLEDERLAMFTDAVLHHAETPKPSLAPEEADTVELLARALAPPPTPPHLRQRLRHRTAQVWGNTQQRRRALKLAPNSRRWLRIATATSLIIALGTALISRNHVPPIVGSAVGQAQSVLWAIPLLLLITLVILWWYDRHPPH